MIQVPQEFQCAHPVVYPPDNEIEFERWFFESWTQTDSRERIYVPIFWTNYYCRNGYGRWPVPIRTLQTYLDSLDRSKKYYTIVQYDNGIMNNLSGLDIKVFAMSGGRTDYPLPLISMPHKYAGTPKKDIFASFVGNQTHPIRRQIMQFRRKKGFHIPLRPVPIDQFCEITARSTFCLAPRGFGPTSFRIQEALQYGAIPVYISDEFIFPHNIDFNEYGVIVGMREARRLDRLLMSITPADIERKRERGAEIYNEYFSYSGVKKVILDNLK